MLSSLPVVDCVWSSLFAKGSFALVVHRSPELRWIIVVLIAILCENGVDIRSCMGDTQEGMRGRMMEINRVARVCNVDVEGAARGYSYGGPIVRSKGRRKAFDSL
jgi:hypothetical protein